MTSDSAPTYKKIGTENVEKCIHDVLKMNSKCTQNAGKLHLNCRKIALKLPEICVQSARNVRQLYLFAI